MYFWSLIKIKINLGADFGGSSSEARLFLYIHLNFIIDMVYKYKVYIIFYLDFYFVLRYSQLTNNVAISSEEQ